MRAQPADEREWLRLVEGERREHLSASTVRRGLALFTGEALRPRVWLFLCAEAFEWLERPPGFNPLKGSVRRDARAQVRKDLPRTFSRGEGAAAVRLPLCPRAALATEAVLLAYARFDPEVGYVQGMNFVAAAVVEVALRAEAAGPLPRGHSVVSFAFGVFVHVFERLNWREVYARGFGKLLELLAALRRGMRAEGLDFVLEALGREQFDLLQVFGGYFFTAMLNCLSGQAAPRAMDLFLLEGESCLLRGLLVAMRMCERRLRCEAETPDRLAVFLAEELFPHLFDNFPDVEPWA